MQDKGEYSKFVNRRKLLFFASTGLIASLATYFSSTSRASALWNYLIKKDSTMKKKLKFKNQSTEKHWVGDGFYVSTLFHPSSEQSYKATSPFILMDYAAPKVFAPSSHKRGVGEHPHRGFETVTIVYAGEVDHKDSSGGGGRIGPGGVQWMTAASGLVHEEMHSESFSKKGGDFEMVQLWVNLPAKDKMAKPRYQGYDGDQIKEKWIDENVKLRMISGEYEGLKGPIESFTEMKVFDLEVKQNSTHQLKLSEGSNTLILVLRGEITEQDKEWTASEGQLLMFDQAGTNIDIDLKAGSKILVLNGEPIREPIASYGPFVMNTKQELMEAIDDFNSGKMGRL